MGPIRPWLPDSALIDDTVCDHFGSVVKHWSEKWFALDAVFEIGPLQRLEQEDANADSCCFIKLESGVAAAISLHDRTRLASRMLGIEGKGLKPKKADEQLLNRLANRALEDLLSMLDETADGRSNSVMRTTQTQSILDQLEEFDFQLPISSDFLGSGGVDICFKRVFAVKARKSLLVTHRKAISLTSAEAAAETVELELSARLGQGGVSIRELEQLASGDVLVLDASTEGIVHLTVAGTQLRTHQCRLENTKDSLNLRVTRGEV